MSTTLPSVLVTNVTQYAGPGTVEVLLQQPVLVICHDPTFQHERARQTFLERYPQVVCLASNEPAELAQELSDRNISIDALVSNDVYTFPHYAY